MHADLAASCANQRLHSQRLHRIDVMFSTTDRTCIFFENPDKTDTLSRFPGHDLTSIKYTTIQPFEILPCPVTQRTSIPDHPDTVSTSQHVPNEH
jgi:hypothetical protein